MKNLALRYIDTLEKMLQLERERVEFYRGKCERLELAIMSQANSAAQQSYAARTDAPPITETKVEMPRHVPFNELKRRWNTLSLEEQEKAIAEGNWNADQPKEEIHEGQ